MARSGRLRSGAGAKLKRWRKGHSSDCNPETRQHRLAARSRFCSRPAGEGREAGGRAGGGGGQRPPVRAVAPGAGSSLPVPGSSRRGLQGRREAAGRAFGSPAPESSGRGGAGAAAPRAAAPGGRGSKPGRSAEPAA